MLANWEGEGHRSKFFDGCICIIMWDKLFFFPIVKSQMAVDACSSTIGSHGTRYLVGLQWGMRPSFLSIAKSDSTYFAFCRQGQFSLFLLCLFV